MGLHSIIWIFVSISLVYGQYKANTTRKRINEEALEPKLFSIELPLDHFNVLDNRTYTGRYYTNDQFYKKGGPIIVYVGGEWEIASYGVMGGVAFQLAKKFDGYLFYPEHRYFGKSLPFPKPVSVENMRYILPDFSIADMVYSISHIKETVEGLKDSQVIVVGGSYAGSLAIWARIKYPHIISAAYNCGGVIETSIRNEGYYSIHYNTYKQTSPTCLNTIMSGIKKAAEMESLPEKYPEFKKKWGHFVCDQPNNRFNITQAIFGFLNPQVWPVYKVRQACHFLDTSTTGSPLERLSQMLEVIKSEEDSEPCDFADREWHFLVCTYLGNVQYTTESNFKSIFDFEQQLDVMCRKKFGPQFTTEFVYKKLYRSELLNGPKTPDATKILSVQGTHDPWVTNAIPDEVNDETPVVYIEDAFHCLELGEEQDDETPQVAQSKFEILEQLAKWIK